MSRDTAAQILGKTGHEAELGAVAQEALDTMSSGMSEESSGQLLELFQHVLDYAAEKAGSGEIPPPDLLPASPDAAAAPGASKIRIAGRPGVAAPVAGLPGSSPSVPRVASPVSGLPGASPSTQSGAIPRMASPVAGLPGASPSTQSGAIRRQPAGIMPPIEKNTFKVVSPDWSGVAPFDSLPVMDDTRIRDFSLALLREVRRRGASDLHLSAMSNPFVRRNGVIEPISDHILTPDEAMRLNRVLLTPEQCGQFDKDKDINYALQIDAHNRFRVCLMVHKDGAAGAYRLVPEEIMSLPGLGFTPENIAVIERFLDYHNGLILVTGPIGSGKTTTLAAMANIVNEKRHDHVITVEDPIEIVQYSKSCNVTQREVHVHTNSYRAALKGALREDPDVIIIGELHDLETIEMAITASETGHLVIGTLHTCDSANTLNRLLDVFPPTQQPQIRAMTAGSLRGIVCQRLLPTVNGGMTVAAEILVNTMAVGNIINEGRTHHLRAVLQTGQNAGMITMDVSVFNLYKKGIISREAAKYNIRGRDVREEFNKLVAAQDAPPPPQKKR